MDHFILSKCHIFLLNNESFSVYYVMSFVKKGSFPANMAVINGSLYNTFSSFEDNKNYYFYSV